VGEQLIELLFVGAMRTLDPAVELGRSRFDVDMTDALIFEMP
jgi:hypothetical protein